MTVGRGYELLKSLYLLNSSVIALYGFFKFTYCSYVIGAFSGRVEPPVLKVGVN